MDEHASSRLPDLPHAGYSTRTEKALSDAMMLFIRGAERDREWLLRMVVEGPDKFRKVFRAAYRFLKIDDDLCNAVYGYLELLAGHNPLGQLEVLARQAHYRATHIPTLRKFSSREAEEAFVRDRIEWVTAQARKRH